jgi:hypothetical protein
VVAHSNVLLNGELSQGSLREGMEVREADRGKQIMGSKPGEAECVPLTRCHSEELLAMETFLRNIFVLTGLFDGDLPPLAMVLPAFIARGKRKTWP